MLTWTCQYDLKARYNGILIQLLTFPVCLHPQAKKHIQLDSIDTASPYFRSSIRPFEHAFNLRTEAESSVRNVALYKTGHLIIYNRSKIV